MAGERVALAVIAEPLGIVNIQRQRNSGEEASACKNDSRPLQKLNIQPWKLFSEADGGDKPTKKRKTIWPKDAEHANRLLLIMAQAWLDRPTSIIETAQSLQWSQLLELVEEKDPVFKEMTWKLASAKFYEQVAVVRKQSDQPKGASYQWSSEWNKTWARVLTRLDRALDEKRSLREINQEPCTIMELGLQRMPEKTIDVQALESREQAVAKREQLVHEKEQLMQDRDQTLQQREAAIQCREKEVIRREETVNYWQLTCEDLERKISSKEEEVNKKEEAARKIEDNAQEKLVALRTIEAEMKQREEAVAKKEQEYRQKCGGMDYSLREKEQFMYMKERELVMKDQMMYARELAVSKREQTMHEADSNLRKKEQEINLQEKNLQEKMKAAQEMEQAVRSREITLYDERTKYIQSLFENKDERDREERMSEFANFAIVIKDMMRDVMRESEQRRAGRS
eukprot:755107-Hanusia_phi.AAC.8